LKKKLLLRNKKFYRIKIVFLSSEKNIIYSLFAKPKYYSIDLKKADFKKTKIF